MFTVLEVTEFVTAVWEVTTTFIRSISRDHIRCGVRSDVIRVYVGSCINIFNF